MGTYSNATAHVSPASHSRHAAVQWELTKYVFTFWGWLVTIKTTTTLQLVEPWGSRGCMMVAKHRFSGTPAGC